jgi:hypothetical protein
MLTTRRGTTFVAVVLASDGDTLILAMVPRGEVAVVAKRDIMDLRVVFAAPPIDYFPPQPSKRQVELPAPPIPPSKRYFGIHLALPPAAMVDVNYGYFMGFASVSFLMPFLTSSTEQAGEPFGGFGSTHLWAFTLGAGATFRFSPTSRWQFDLFAIGGGTNWNANASFAEPVAAFGLGLGFHITLESGFSFGIKGPIVGGATGTENGSTASLGSFFAASLVGLPLVSFGYRF